MALVILSGVSHAGKSTLADFLHDTHDFSKVITCTSRAMRTGEQQGVDYHFFTKGEFKEKLDMNYFLEHVMFSNNYYGVSKQELVERATASKHSTIVVEPIGHKAIVAFLAKENLPYLSVFINCPENIVQQRYAERCQASSDASDKAEVEMVARALSIKTIEQEWRAEAAVAGTYDIVFESLFSDVDMINASKTILKKCGEG